MNTNGTWNDTQLTIFPPAREDHAHHLAMTDIGLSFAKRGLVANFVADENEIPFVTRELAKADDAGLQVLQLKDTCNAYSGVLVRFPEPHTPGRNLIFGFIKTHDDSNTVGPVMCVGGVEGEGS